ncbi:hypothetical protein [Lactobacillus panisapium]|nr:hypothetical protein [Lactobacillus panisapium]
MVNYYKIVLKYYQGNLIYKTSGHIRGERHVSALICLDNFADQQNTP